MRTMSERTATRLFDALDRFRLEVPSWGFADTGTRFGVFHQPAAASTISEKLADAGFVHRLTGLCPTVALHVQWDLPGGVADVANVQQLAAEAGIRPGSINPNFFQHQRYKHGSFGNPDPEVRAQARAHGLASMPDASGQHARPSVGEAGQPRSGCARHRSAHVRRRSGA